MWPAAGHRTWRNISENLDCQHFPVGAVRRAHHHGRHLTLCGAGRVTAGRAPAWHWPGVVQPCLEERRRRQGLESSRWNMGNVPAARGLGASRRAAAGSRPKSTRRKSVYASRRSSRSSLGGDFPPTSACHVDSGSSGGSTMRLIIAPLFSRERRALRVVAAMCSWVSPSISRARSLRRGKRYDPRIHDRRVHGVNDIVNGTMNGDDFHGKRNQRSPRTGSRTASTHRRGRARKQAQMRTPRRGRSPEAHAR